MIDLCSHWLVGGSGLAHSALHNAVGSGLYTATTLDDSFTRLGHSQLTPFFVLRQAQRLAIGANHGLWEWRRDETRYIQLHDETLTEVLGLAAVPGDPGLVIACSYGIATAYRDELGAARWTFHSDSPVPDERFANALYIDPAHPDQWLVGTEAGVFIYLATDHQWQASDLNGTPVRALCSARGRLWAGTDDRGILHSEDGMHWTLAGSPVEGAVYALHDTGSSLLAATQYGIVTGDGDGSWTQTGPRLSTTSITSTPRTPGTWAAGASPGGLWHTRDAGGHWQQAGDFKHVRVVLAPEEI